MNPKTLAPAPCPDVEPSGLRDLLERDGIDFLPRETYRFLGRELCVRANSRSVLDHLRLVYGRFHRGGEPDEDARTPAFEIVDRLDGTGELLVQDDHKFYRLTGNGVSWQVTCQDRRSPERVVQGSCSPRTLVQAALLETVAASVTDCNLFHAGAVSLDGAGVVLAAPSGMGKTTLTLDLVRRGCGFLSDEVACLGPDALRLEPFPRALNLRRESRELLGIDLGAEEEVCLDIEDIHPARISGRCEPRHLLFLRGFADAPQLEPISRIQAGMELLGLSIGRLLDPAGLLFRYAPLLRTMRCHNLVVGPLQATADLVMSLPEQGSGSG